MKSLYIIDELLICFLAAIGYGLGYVVPYISGVSFVFSILLCFVFGILAEYFGEKLVFSPYVQRKPSRRFFVGVLIILFFVIVFFISKKYFNYSLGEDLKEEIAYVLMMPVIAFVISSITSTVEKYLLYKKYKDGSSGFLFNDKERWYVKNLNGINKKVYGQYDKKLKVKTTTGTFIGKRETNIITYFGIPYSKQPTGKYRWKKPVPCEPKKYVQEAFYLGPSVIQLENKHNPLTEHRQSEDCLYLNVIKGLEKGTKKPVLVYVHGGDFIYGGPAHPLWSGKNLIRNFGDIVYVSFNYRFGVLGFIDFSDIKGGEEYKEAVNVGLLDQIEALKWVKNNISKFGGDPNNITVMGDTAGACCLSLLCTKKEVKGLFKRVFLIGGYINYVLPNTEVSRELGSLIAKEFNAKNMNDLLLVSEKDLKKALQKNLFMVSCPCVDNNIVKKDYEEKLKKGIAKDIEFINVFFDKDYLSVEAMYTEEEYEKWLDSNLTDIYYYDKSKAGKKVNEMLKKDRTIKGKHKALSYFIQESIIEYTNILADAGSKVHCIKWDIGSHIKKFKASAISMVATILGNDYASSIMGYVINENVKEILQALLMKYMRGKKLGLYNNEISGIKEIKWPKYTSKNRECLEITEKEIKNIKI